MDSFKDKYAVVSGAGAGIGMALATQLVSEGCNVAICDIDQARLDAALANLTDSKPDRVEVFGFCCDTSDEAQVASFAAALQSHFEISHLNLLVNNAGVNGGGSFIHAPREEWERTYDICWNSVYLMTRHFLPLLMSSAEGHIVNMSSANGIRAVLGGQIPHTAYSTAKFAIKGFSESLIHDFRFNAPHLGVSVVMPGHTGTNIITNSLQTLGQNPPETWDEQDLQRTRTRWRIAGRENALSMSDADVRQAGRDEADQMRELGMPPADVASIILQGVKDNEWRILVGEDTESLDQLVRESPDEAYAPDFAERWRLRTLKNAEKNAEKDT